MPKTTFVSSCETCKAKFEGDDAEAQAIACEQSHPKAIEIIEQIYDHTAPQSLIPSTITVKLDSGVTANYRFNGR